MIQVADHHTLANLGPSLQVTEVLVSSTPDNLQAEMSNCLIDSIGGHVVIKVVDEKRPASLHPGMLLRSLSFMAINPLMRPSRSHLEKTIETSSGHLNKYIS